MVFPYVVSILVFADKVGIMTFGHGILLDFNDNFSGEILQIPILQIGAHNLLISDLIHLFNSSQNHVCVVSNIAVASETQ